ncbi:MAG: DUF6732 family protein [Pseudomonadota bacterium]
MRFSILSVFFFLSFVNTGHAHWGHVGDLAGHAHWIGIGAVVVAGALAGLVGILNKEDDDAQAEDEAEAPDGETA